jgi:hypothetical protein
MGLSQAVVVFSNNATPGDSYTNSSSVTNGQAIGASDWYYNNVKNNGIVGVNNTYARNGNGSVYLSTTQGPGGASSKADVELLAKGVNVGGTYYASGYFGTLGNLTTLSYDWYRDSVSTNGAVQMPSLRILLDADGDLSTIGDRGGLVFERAYNSLPALTDQWVTDTITQSTNVWAFSLGASEIYRPLSDWTEGKVTSILSANSKIIGFSSGVGSGWGPFVGAVDNITIGFKDGDATTYNFEAAGGASSVPGPAAILPMALGLLVAFRRRSKK